MYEPEEPIGTEPVKKKNKAPALTCTMAQAQLTYAKCVVDILDQLGTPPNENWSSCPGRTRTLMR